MPSSTTLSLKSEFNNITKMLTTTEVIFSDLFLDVTKADVMSAIDSGKHFFEPSLASLIELLTISFLCFLIHYIQLP